MNLTSLSYLNISRYVSTAKPEEVINLAEVNQALAKTESDIKKFTDEHNAYLKELMSLFPKSINNDWIAV
jgi:type I restriction-modification system DNA methylase subunit